jgi:hypothetical protein
MGRCLPVPIDCLRNQGHLQLRLSSDTYIPPHAGSVATDQSQAAWSCNTALPREGGKRMAAVITCRVHCVLMQCQEELIEQEATPEDRVLLSNGTEQKLRRVRRPSGPKTVCVM